MLLQLRRVNYGLFLRKFAHKFRLTDAKKFRHPLQMRRLLRIVEWPLIADEKISLSFLRPAHVAHSLISRILIGKNRSVKHVN